MNTSLNRSGAADIPIANPDLSREEAVSRVWEACAQHKGFNEGFQKAVGQFQLLTTGLFISFTLFGIARGLQREELDIYRLWTIEEPSLPFLSRAQTLEVAEWVEETALTVSMMLIGFLFFAQLLGVYSPGV